MFIDDLQKEVFESSYQIGDETPDEMWHRVATFLSSKEKNKDYWEDRFFSNLEAYHNTLGGRILSNAGAGYKGTSMLNCFVLGPRPNEHGVDSIPEIYRNLTEQALTLKTEGGWGYNFSHLRPRGSYIKGIGVQSPGAIRFMELYDKSSEIITSGGGEEGRKIKGQKKKIRKGAQMGMLECVAGDSLVNTLEGKIPIKNLVGKKPLLYCTDTKGNVFIRKADKVWNTGIRRTMKINLDNHDSIECTPEHKIMLSDGNWKKAKDLQFGDSLGVISRKLYSGRYLYIGVSGSSKMIAEHMAVCEYKYGQYSTASGKNRKPTDTIIHHIDHNPLNNLPENIQLLTIKEHGKIHSDNLKHHQKRIALERKGKSLEEYYGDDKAKQIKAKVSISRKGQIAWNKNTHGDEYKDHYPDGFSNQFVNNLNHKVISIEESTEQEVYDIAVPDFHNFTVNDVVVHNCWHPGIKEFILAKQIGGKLTKFNLSIAITNKFMSAVENDEDWDLIFPDTKDPKYNEVWDGNIEKWKDSGHKVEIYDTISARVLWEKIMEASYSRNEPGVFFIDNANHFNNLKYCEHITCTNPCGEIPLPPWASCLLGSINLVHYLNANRTDWNYENLKRDIPTQVRMMDNVVDLTYLPLPEQKEKLLATRRIGLGVMGYGSALYMLGIKYGSKQSLDITDKLMSHVANIAYRASADLAQEKGSFPEYDKEKYWESNYVKQALTPETIKYCKSRGMRNSHLLAIAPTGNTSVYAGVVSGGLEPVFAKEYTRTVQVHDRPVELEMPKYWEGEYEPVGTFKWVKEGDDDILRTTIPYEGHYYKIDKNRGLTKESVVKDYGWRFIKDEKAAVTTADLKVKHHINTMKVFAHYVDQAISKTVNIPNNYPYEDFKNLYMDAWKAGIKGITTYRDGTMASVLSVKEERHDGNGLEETIIQDDVKLPDNYDAKGVVLRAEGKKWYLNVPFLPESDRPFALFVSTNHPEPSVHTLNTIEVLEGLATEKGIPQKWIDSNRIKCASQRNATKIARSVSLLLRHGVAIRNIVGALDKVEIIPGAFVFQIKKYLASFLKEGTPAEGICPQCGSNKLVFTQGCKECVECRVSLCG